MPTFGRYLARKALWYLGALVAAVVLNWYLPRLIPGNPVDALVSSLGRGVQGEQVQRIHAAYVHQFHLDQPLWAQFATYLGNLAHGDLGQSFGNYPASVSGLILAALPWTLALQLPAILVGWVAGNTLGAVAAYKGGWLDRGAYLGSLFVFSMPYY